MSLEVEWCADNIIHVNFQNHWDWSEFHTGIQRAYTLMSKSEKIVHLMVDFIGSVKHVQTSALSNIVDEVETPTNQGMIVVVTEDELLGSKLANILSQMQSNKNVSVVASGEEAISMIRNSVSV